MSISGPKQMAIEGKQELGQAPALAASTKWSELGAEKIKGLFDGLVALVAQVSVDLPEVRQNSKQTEDHAVEATRLFESAALDVTPGSALAAPAEGMVVNTMTMRTAAEAAVTSGEMTSDYVRILSGALRNLSSDMIELHRAANSARVSAERATELQPRALYSASQFIEQVDQ